MPAGMQGNREAQGMLLRGSFLRSLMFIQKFKWPLRSFNLRVNLNCIFIFVQIKCCKVE